MGRFVDSLRAYGEFCVVIRFAREDTIRRSPGGHSYVRLDRQDGLVHIGGWPTRYSSRLRPVMPQFAQRFLACALTISAWWFLHGPSFGDDTPPSFNRDIRPILSS